MGAGLKGSRGGGAGSIYRIGLSVHAATAYERNIYTNGKSVVYWQRELGIYVPEIGVRVTGQVKKQRLLFCFGQDSP